MENINWYNVIINIVFLLGAIYGYSEIRHKDLSIRDSYDDKEINEYKRRKRNLRAVRVIVIIIALSSMYNIVMSFI